MSELTSLSRIETELVEQPPESGRLRLGLEAPAAEPGGGGPRLRLRKLIVQGFKSFADKTEFVFDRPIVGIVGPNGCGKSNVVDAVKWVLGEQSAKSLRGDAMLDVIFNGAAGRQPGSFAEVTLVFDNPADGAGARLLPLDADEVAVGRQLLRDGTSLYKLNGRVVRLKDVRDLFLDTGIGVDAYSVIEQGRVAAMLEASSTERRTIFEEAAGISRYKVKKKEAQRKLERVEQNLLRLTDIVEEVEKRLRSVKIAAGKARSYQELTGQLAELRLKSAIHDYHTLCTRRNEATKQRDEAQFALDDVTIALGRAQNALATKRQEAEQIAEARKQAEFAVVQTQGRIERATQRLEHAEQQAREIEHQVQGLQAEQEEARRLSAENDAALEQDQQALDRSGIELGAATARIEAAQSEHRDAQLQQAQAQRDLEELNNQMLRAMNEVSAIERRASNLQIEQETIARRSAELSERSGRVTAELAAAEERAREKQARLEEIEASARSGQAALEAKRGEATRHGQTLSAIGEQLVAGREHRSALHSRQRVLHDLEARREGLGEGVKQILREREERYGFILGLVADLLHVDIENAAVIEAALDGRDQWLIADPEAHLPSQSEALAGLPGRVNILRRTEMFAALGETPNAASDPSPTDSISPFDAWETPWADDQSGHDPLAGRLTPKHISELANSLTADRFDWSRFGIPVTLAVNLVRCEPQDRSLAMLLLGKTVVVETLADALQLQRKGPPGIRYVTRGGEVIEADGTLRAGPLAASMSILSRRSELAALGSQIADADAQLEHLTAYLAEGNEQSRRLDAELNAIRERLYDLSAARVETSGKLGAEQDRSSALRREIPSIDSEHAELGQKIQSLQAEQQGLSQRRQSLDVEKQMREVRAGELTAAQESLAGRIAAAAEALTAARVALGQAQEQQIAARRGVERHTARAAELGAQIERIGTSLFNLQGRSEEVAAQRDAAAADRRRLEVDLRDLTERVEELGQSLEAARTTIEELAGVADRSREQHDQAAATLAAAETALAELAVRVETLVSRAAEETELDLPGRYAELCAVEGGYIPADEDWAAIAEEMKEIRARISRLGNVNIDAIAEQEELEGRATNLADQLKDLSDSKQQLEELIETINRESGLRFEETFIAVREHFQTMFRKLFGGGRADIYLETEVEERQRDEEGKVTTIMRKVDPLEAGIEIVAKPPGKQPVTISQLSGGEKTMTCVALLMSIFKSKPSPFCILDEVDAALDEANNVRFNRIVEEFLGESQFIIITHSKRTMQVADVLYGVTMQEQGVSKRVSVRFDQIGEGGRIHAEAAA